MQADCPSIPAWFKTLEGPDLLKQILKSYDDGTLATELTAYREHIEESGIAMTTQRHMRPVFGTHAVKRVIQRRMPVDAIAQIAEYGVTVQESGIRVMKRGEVRGMPVHVVVEAPNVIVSVYFADEWQSTISVERVGKSAMDPMIAVM